MKPNVESIRKREICIQTMQPCDRRKREEEGKKIVTFGREISFLFSGNKSRISSAK